MGSLPSTLKIFIGKIVIETANSEKNGWKLFEKEKCQFASIFLFDGSLFWRFHCSQKVRFNL